MDFDEKTALIATDRPSPLTRAECDAALPKTYRVRAFQEVVTASN